MTVSGGTSSWWRGLDEPPILLAPPFPGSNDIQLTVPLAADSRPASEEEAAALIDAMRRLRVGGTFWAKRPALPEMPHIIARPSSPAQARAMLEQSERSGIATLFWFPTEMAARSIDAEGMAALIGACDPWHIFSRTKQIWADANDDIALLASMARCGLRTFGDGPYATLNNGTDQDVLAAVRSELLNKYGFIEPFHQRAASAAEIVQLLGQWRTLIDSNKQIGAVYGVAFWKRGSVDPLLWNGEGPVSFNSATSEALQQADSAKAMAIWKARVPADFLAQAEQSGSPLLEIEDGFIRSAGLGADCVPPLSIVVDGLCAHYDPSGPSGLENLLVKGDFPPELLRRAEELRQLIVSTGISKYAVGNAIHQRRGGDRKHILVTGQVEDDRSVLKGGGEVKSNLDLLHRVRTLEPKAYIIYRPHPDVDAGHRKGHIPDAQALTLANEIAREAPITALIDMADHVHVLTSLVGFEALIRGKSVTTHGVPFYAGWGLTTDLGPVPARRNAERSLTELIAATLLLYPRYLDPLTGLPCPPEVLIERLAAGVKKENSVIVLLRRLQGTLMRTMKGF